MKYYCEGWFHFKNKLGMDLMIQNGMDVDFEYNSEKEYDCIISLSEFNEFPNHKNLILYGPHMSFPDVNIDTIPKGEKIFCNSLSNWNKKLCESILPGVKFLPLPFAVDVNRFVPKEKTGKPIIYFKSVDIERLRDVVRTLKIDFDIFNYNSGYSEQEYQEAISHAPYIIWIGRHESQGFAFQEALSSNCPIFVIDVKSLREEINSSWVNYLPNHKLQATAASYFDSSCGLITYPERWKEDWDKFLQGNYSPREFVLNNLSPSACIKIWNETLKNLK